MHHLLHRFVLIFSFCTCFLLRGGTQTFSLVPQAINLSVNLDSAETRAHLTLRNPSFQAKKYTWQLNILSMTNTWQTLVCDTKGCAPIGVTANSYKLDIPANGTNTLDVVIRPNKQLGAATLELKVTEVGNESNVSISRILFSTASALKEYSRVNSGGIRVYPNPATDFFMVTDDANVVDRVVVYNIIGRQVKNQKAVENFKYTVNDLPEGLYIVRLLNANGATLRTIRLNKSRIKA
jgi:Secretion system C-terminal sorting domain